MHGLSGYRIRGDKDSLLITAIVANLVLLAGELHQVGVHIDININCKAANSPMKSHEVRKPTCGTVVFLTGIE
jgi:hypothetical protein